MNRAFSTYLDFTRFAAAFVVVLHHLGAQRLTGGIFDPVGAAGEDAVMVFFVLSGYVIAYVSDRDRNLPNYAISRFARLYSVVVPALLLTVVADAIGSRANPALYEGILDDSHALAKTLVSLGFLNQLWSIDVRFFSNVPYWSISYEFWYYVLFGCVFFARGSIRTLLIVAWSLLVGPCILLLLPVWWLGVLTYRYTRNLTLQRLPAWLCAVLPIPMYLAYRTTGIGDALTGHTDDWILRLTGDPYYLHKARFFLHDYIVGLLVAVHLVGAHGIAATRGPAMTHRDRIIRGAAGYTFSTYLFHYPTLYCLAAISPFATDSFAQVAYLLLGTTAVVLAIGRFTEARKDVWMGVLQHMYGRIQVESRRLPPHFSLPPASFKRPPVSIHHSQWYATLGTTLVLILIVVAGPVASREHETETTTDSQTLSVRLPVD